MKKRLNVSLLGKKEYSSIEQRNAFITHCFEVLYPDLLMIAHGFFNNEKDAEDCAIDFFEKLMHWPASRFRRPKNLTGYILTSAYNHCITAYGKNQNQPFIIDIDDVFTVKHSQKGVDERLVIQEQLEDAQKLITHLSEPQQHVITLYAQGYSHKEIAATLDISISTSTSRLNRARQNLRSMLAHQLAEAEKPGLPDG